ncbi:MAG: two-component sensor histidine kinase [Thiotrichales bacterium]|jgi:two-component system sensor histidine kinase QseC|nr:two-component sensor histidine kinase [Thiotrichales bacterium]MBT3613082.1 two-component sensor histidine kinase [Thiotrichales bacterium]MBT3752125.1 two-component sensor histidine kinase [Thiotrichales bacterium]MBT3837797.1 two-component sensor histidine kinase [Thiotrichales bacterium]MBT4152375.1 two-component sensor histidine kinase [Thiotrichales bacterium]
MNSIRNRLLLLLLGVFTSVWVVMMGYIWQNTEHEIEEVFDAQLAQASLVLLDLTQHEITEMDLDDFRSDLFGAEPVHEYEKKVAFQVWRGDKLLLRSNSAPATPMSRVAGYSSGEMGGERWRFLHRVDTTGVLIAIVGEQYEMRNELEEKIILQLFWPITIALPLLALLMTLGITRGLHPLKSLAAEVASRSPTQLEEITAKQVPQEVSPLIDSINTLLKRVAQTIEAEHRFTADASHELRTPLAAIKTQAQVAKRTEGEVSDSALDKVVEGVDRTSHLVEQLLTLTRLDPSVVQRCFEEVDLTVISERVMAELAPTALVKNIELTMVGQRGEVVNGSAPLLQILLRNLIENGINYTHFGGKVIVTVNTEGEEIVLKVSDNGLGIPEDIRQRVFDRFYRIEGSSVPGSGLGLSIVKRVVDIHAGTVEIEGEQPHGTRVVIEI